MENIRPIHELLIILRDNAKVVNGSIEVGLCEELYRIWVVDSLMTRDEEVELLNYIRYNRPSWNFDDRFGWQPTLWLPRLKWLNKHIELTKPVMAI